MEPWQTWVTTAVVSIGACVVVKLVLDRFSTRYLPIARVPCLLSHTSLFIWSWVTMACGVLFVANANPIGAGFCAVASFGLAFSALCEWHRSDLARRELNVLCELLEAAGRSRGEITIIRDSTLYNMRRHYGLLRESVGTMLYANPSDYRWTTVFQRHSEHELVIEVQELLQRQQTRRVADEEFEEVLTDHASSPPLATPSPTPRSRPTPPSPQTPPSPWP